MCKSASVLVVWDGWGSVRAGRLGSVDMGFRGFRVCRFARVFVVRAALGSVAVACLGFRWCGLFGVPCVYDVLGPAVVGCFGFRGCGSFWVPMVWVFLVLRWCGLFWVPSMWVVLGERGRGKGGGGGGGAREKHEERKARLKRNMSTIITSRSPWRAGTDASLNYLAERQR